jgi:glycine/D-amino acid oxidase-like deaminating enzyme
VLWEAANPYLYLRLHGNILVAGGRDEQSATRYSERAALAQKRRLITGDVHDMVPDLTWRASHVWAGAFGSSPSALPLIDRVPDHSRCWFVAALGGSMIAAEIICEALRGGADPDAPLFRL